MQATQPAAQALELVEAPPTASVVPINTAATPMQAATMDAAITAPASAHRRAAASIIPSRCSAHGSA